MNIKITKLIMAYIAVSSPGMSENVTFTKGKIALVIRKNMLNEARITEHSLRHIEQTNSRNCKDLATVLTFFSLFIRKST